MTAANIGTTWERLVSHAPRSPDITAAMRLAGDALEGMICAELTLAVLAAGDRHLSPTAIASAVRRACDDFHLTLGARGA